MFWPVHPDSASGEREREVIVGKKRGEPWNLLLQTAHSTDGIGNLLPLGRGLSGPAGVGGRASINFLLPLLSPIMSHTREPSKLEQKHCLFIAGND